MLLRTTLAIALSCAAQSSVPAHARPDLTGTWTLTSRNYGCDNPLTLVQDESSLRVRTGTAGVLVYRFDGTDTRQDTAAPERSPDLTPGTWDMHRTRLVARAAWDGDRFVVVTHITMTTTWPSQQPGSFDRDWTYKDSYSLGDAGSLIVDRRVILDPMPGGSPRRIDLPDTWSCAYARK
jgi:hypothetical protein